MEILQGKHSAILLNFIKVPIVFWIFILFIFCVAVLHMLYYIINLDDSCDPVHQYIAALTSTSYKRHVRGMICQSATRLELLLDYLSLQS